MELVWFQSAILWEKFLRVLSTIYILLLFIAAEWIQFAYLLYEKKDAPKEASFLFRHD